jgi:hypothetical protein
MKNRLLPFLILLMVGLGCGSADKTTEGPKKQQLQSVTSPHILVQSEPKGKTGVYQQDFRILPELVVNGEAIAPGEHSFDLFSTSSYSGKKPSCDAKSLVLTIGHSTSRDISWRFPPNTTASVIVDGTPIDLKVYSQQPYAMPAMAKYLKNPEAAEGLIIAPGCELYQRMSKAKTIEFQIGNASFKLEPEGVASFREFAQDIGFK